MSGDGAEVSEVAPFPTPAVAETESDYQQLPTITLLSVAGGLAVCGIVATIGNIIACIRARAKRCEPFYIHRFVYS